MYKRSIVAFSIYVLRENAENCKYVIIILQLNNRVKCFSCVMFSLYNHFGSFLRRVPIILQDMKVKKGVDEENRK